jgi:hypothetical protein
MGRDEGDLTVTSELGNGSEFTRHFPAARVIVVAHRRGVNDT